MKSKSPHSFWLRWFAASTVYTLAFMGIWMNNSLFYANWFYAYLGFNFMMGILLSAMQYWAMSPLMRPNASRWFLSSILSWLVAIGLHQFVMQNPVPGFHLAFLWLSFFLPPAIGQSWALSERFNKAWIFGLSFLLPAFLLISPFPVPLAYQNYSLYEFIIHMLRAFTMGSSLVVLQNRLLKETSAFDASSEHLALQDEEETVISEEGNKLLQAKRS